MAVAQGCSAAEDMIRERLVGGWLLSLTAASNAVAMLGLK
jgi:hypothetical protein